MKGKTPRRYSTEFKLKLVKEYLETDKSYREMGFKYNMDFSVISDWVNRYKVYKDKAFKTNQRRRYSFIADESKIPAFLREELELDKKDEYGDAVKELKEEIERLKSKLVERDLKIRMLNEVSKKKEEPRKGITEIRRLLVANRYISWGFRKSFVLKVLGIPRSSYYHSKTITFFLKNKREKRYRGYSYNTYGGITKDESLEELLKNIRNEDSRFKREFYLKFLGSRKMAEYIRDHYKIIVNHKKIHRFRKKLEMVGEYTKQNKQPVRRSRAREITQKNELWESDICFANTNEGKMAILAVIDVYDRNLIGVYVGSSCKNGDFTRLIDLLIKQRGKPQVIRTDNGSQFRAINTGIFMMEQEIVHEFGLKRNPNSQAFIESFFASLKREFVKNNTFEDLDDLCRKLNVYLDYYNNLRPHGSLKNKTPGTFSIQSNKEILCVNR